MPFIETPLAGALIFEPKVFGDSRGSFFESYSKNLFSEAGVDCNFVQDNQSYSKYGTVRGLHFQTGDHVQAKLVRVLKGKVLDVIVDIRSHSKTYGQTFSIELSDENQKQLYVPHGFAHGFSVLSDDAVFFYKCDDFYHKASEGGICFNDAGLKIDWCIPADLMV